MGNFSVSHYARIEPEASSVKFTYVLDLAELPSFELIQKWGLKLDSPLDEMRRKAADEARGWASTELRFTLDGRSLAPPRLLGVDVVRADGAGAMAVLRITTQFEFDAKPGVLEFEDATYRDREGWKEIVIRGAGVTRASHGSKDLSAALTAYPQDAIAAPPQDLRARLEWGNLPASATVIERIPQPQSANPPQAPPRSPTSTAKGDGLSQLIAGKNLSGMPLLLALGLAFVFGAAHATSPGHGKTMVAAYLVGERGTAMHAVLLGAVTTLTHTASVFALGLATYFFAGSFAPDKVTRLLEFVSGVSIAILGLWLVYKRTLPLQAAHHGHHHHAPEGDSSLGSLIALGASGGLVPCPSALVLLLTSIALGKVAAGLVLLVAFSLGLASVLVGIGLAVLYAKSLLPAGSMSSDNRFFRLLPVFSACAIVLIGLFLTGVSLGWVKVTL
jgi:ABC-type nickel/cobalt efflux system permease component RcnA